MLFYESTSPELLELLKLVQRESVFSDLRLVGGTALALQIGHRKSIDIDLFGDINQDEYKISKTLSLYGKVTILKQTENIKIYLVNDIKLDIVKYPYKWLNEPVIIDGLKLASISDIAAMKLNAIAGRGTKKDFIDLFFLLKEFSLRQMIDLYNAKYHDGSDFMVLKSLTYFDDANYDEMPFMITAANWDEIKITIKSEVARFE